MAGGIIWSCTCFTLAGTRRMPRRSSLLLEIGMFYKFGKPHSFLSKLSRNVMSVADTKDERNIGRIDPREIAMEGSNYYTYIASLFLHALKVLFGPLMKRCRRECKSIATIKPSQDSTLPPRLSVMQLDRVLPD